MNLTYNVWTTVTTTTVDTLFQARNGRVLITTQNPTGSNFADDDDAIEITDNSQINGMFVVPAGLTVYAKPVAFPKTGSPPSIAFTPFGI
jgi:hypothetical protein